MRFYYLVLLTVLPAMGQWQRFTFGVEGGVPAQTPLGKTDSQMPFVLGPTVNISILPRLSLETGVLFYRMGQQLNNAVLQYPQDTVTLISGQESGRALEIPFLARYHLNAEHHKWRPFLSAGPAVRRTSLDVREASTILSGTPVSNFPLPSSINANRVNWSVDPEVGAGIDLRSGRFHFAPEVRYSYWGAGTNSSVRKNQVHFLLGFRF